MFAAQKPDDTNIRKFKICLLGDAAVGKTAFAERHTTGIFLKTYTRTWFLLIPLCFLCIEYVNKQGSQCSILFVLFYFLLFSFIFLPRSNSLTDPKLT